MAYGFVAVDPLLIAIVTSLRFELIEPFEHIIMKLEVLFKDMLNEPDDARGYAISSALLGLF